MGSFIQDLRYAARMLAKTPGYALIAILTLALGIGANTAIFSVVNAVLLRPLPYPDSDRLMELGRADAGSDAINAISEPKYVFLRDHARSFEALTATTGMGSKVSLTDDARADAISGVWVSAEFFRVLGVAPAMGRGFTKEEDSPAGGRVAILGDALWRQWFGADAGVLGKSIMLNGVAHTVVGVMPAGFNYSGVQDVLVPMRVNPESRNEGHNSTVIGRLAPGVTQEQARAEAALLAERFREAKQDQIGKSETFGVKNWRASLTGDVKGLLWLLMGAVGFVLLIACANLANLQLTRASARQREMAIRRALGAGAGRVLRQLLSEGLLLSLLGGVAGILLAVWGTAGLLSILPEGLLPRIDEINQTTLASLNGGVLAFALMVSVLTGVLFSLAPALQSLRIDINRALKDGGERAPGGASRGGLRNALVVIEVALALILLVGAGLVLRTFAHLRGVDPGFDPGHVLTFEIAPRREKYKDITGIQTLYRDAVERIRRLPGVEAVATTNKLPLDFVMNLPYRIAGDQNKFSGSAEYRLITPEYFRVMKMSLRNGRSFADSDRADAEPVAIVNEALVKRHLDGVDPLGQRLCAGCEYGDPTMRRIIGVVNDAKQLNLVEKTQRMVFIPLSQANENVRAIALGSSFVVRTPLSAAALKPAFENEIRQIDPQAPIRALRPLDQLVSRSIAPQRFNLSLLGLFAGLGLLLAAVGVYGVLSYTVEQRTHEIGVRMALGAQRSDVLQLVIRQGMRPALLGVLVGVAGSFALTRVMKSLLYGVSAADPLTFGVIAGLMTLAALAACSIPARQAASVDPMIALRCD